MWASKFQTATRRSQRDIKNNVGSTDHLILQSKSVILKLGAMWAYAGVNGIICNCLFIRQGFSLGLSLPRYLHKTTVSFFVGVMTLFETGKMGN